MQRQMKSLTTLFAILFLASHWAFASESEKSEIEFNVKRNAKSRLVLKLKHGPAALALTGRKHSAEFSLFRFTLGDTTFDAPVISKSSAQNGAVSARLTGNGSVLIQAQGLDLEQLMPLDLTTDGRKSVSLAIAAAAVSTAGSSVTFLSEPAVNIVYRVHKGQAIGRQAFGTSFLPTFTTGLGPSIIVSPAVAIVTAGTTQQFNATILDENGLPVFGLVDWSVNGGGTIDPSGLFVAGDTPGGPFTVFASASFFGVTHVGTVGITSGSARGSASVTVVQSTTPSIVLISQASVTVNGSTAVFSVGATGESLTFTWDFGDGISGSGESTSHTYAFPAAYIATVTIQDISNNQLTSSVSVIINPSTTGTSIVTTPGGGP
jgi:hypothetical protein